MTEILDSDTELQQLKAFVANLVHDLKNTTQAQIISLELFKNGTFGIVNQEQVKMLGYMLESAENMKMLLYSVLGFYTKKSCEIVLNKTKISPILLLQDCLNECFGYIRYKQLKIETDFSAGTGLMILGDNMQLRRVFSNLMNNAFEYSAPNTMVKIGLKIIDKNIEISFFNEINKSDKKPQDMGFGLGLGICEQIVKSHNGKFRTEKLNGTFLCIVELPIS